MSIQQSVQTEIHLICDNDKCKKEQTFTTAIDHSWFILRVGAPTDMMTIAKLRTLPKAAPRASNIRGGTQQTKCFCSADCATTILTQDIKNFLSIEPPKTEGYSYSIISSR